MGKTELALMFEKDLTHRLKKVKREDFTGYDYFEYQLIVGTPAKEFWTAKGEVSKTSIDFDAHKVFTDVVAEVMGFNDGQIVFHPFLKIPIDSPYWFFAVGLKACKAKDVVQTWNEKEFMKSMEDLGYQIL